MSAELIKNLSGETWQEIIKLLGSGDFVKIEFRPPESEDEYEIAKMSGFPATSTWWICEATYMECPSWPGGYGNWQQITQKIPFRLTASS